MREDFAGWFVEVPRKTKEEFKKLYPGRSAQRKVTLAAIEWAIKSHPSNNRADEDRQLRIEHAPVMSGQISAANDGRMDKQA